MVDQPGDSNTVVARYKSGTADEDRLNGLIAEAWAESLKKDRQAIADLLGVPADELNPDNPPVAAEGETAGIFGAEILIALSTGFALGFTKEFGKTVGGYVGKKAGAALLKLWEDYLHDRVNPPGTGVLRDEIKKSDDA